MPDLNEKFHFKSVTTLHNNLPSSIRQKQMDNNMNLLKIQSNGLDVVQNDMDEQNKSQVDVKVKEVSDYNHNINQNENTKSILRNCGLINQKNKNVKVLLKG